ncbi:MAG: flagellar hook-associated protein FlgK [Phycisphaerales bacterium]
MSLNSSLQIGRSGLTVSQLGLQVTGNNISNAASPGYSRQTALLQPVRDARVGRFYTGRGAEAAGIRRGVDEALQSRLRSGISAQAGAATDLELLGNVEATLNALSDSDLSSQLGRFFSSWSELANAPSQSSARSVVVQQGRSSAAYIRTLRTNLLEQQSQIDRDITSAVNAADALLSQVAELNTQIAAGGGGDQQNALKDQRDSALAELSGFFNLSTVVNENGSVDVFVGSTPVVQAGRSRGVGVALETENGATSIRVTVGADGQSLDIAGGRVGALLANRTTLVDETVTRLDALASQLIHLVNRAHSTGFGTTALTSVTGTFAVATADRSVAINDPANGSFARLPVRPNSGSFLVTVTNSATGSSQTVRVNIDLDGITNAGGSGTADDTTLTSLTADLDAIDNLSATIDGNGRLRLDAASGYQMTFAEDTSGALAVLGVNTYFTGTDASNISVREELVSNSSLLSTARTVNGATVDNGAALAIAQVRDTPQTGLGGVSLFEHWDQTVQSVGTRAGNARVAADAATIVADNLDAQRQAISGVSIDEEAINLLLFQRQYQASAQFISKIDELTQVLLGILA